MIINAENKILGRFATIAAKHALLGETVNIVNCEKAVIAGERKKVIDFYLRKRKRTHIRGPFMTRLPDRFVRRTIRGMLPYKQPKGVAAFKKIRCFMGVPDKFKDIPSNEKIKGTTQLPNFKFITIGELCKSLGGKK